jgi:hypothetical protein
MDLLFQSTRRLEIQLDEYLDLVVQGGLYYRSAVGAYLEGRTADFEEKLTETQRIESQADELRRRIETRLYSETLLPESRGDVLGLLESMDRVLDRCEDSLQDFSVERPEIVEFSVPDFRELVTSTIDCVDSMVMAMRSYLRDPKAVRDHIARARFHEGESDRANEKLRRKIFASDMDLASKLHHRYFAVQMDRIADKAEDVCDRLAIATIKRSM